MTASTRGEHPMVLILTFFLLVVVAFSLPYYLYVGLKDERQPV